MKYVKIFLISCFLLGCATPSKETTVITQPIKHTENILPTVQKTSENVSEIIKKNVKLETKIEENQKTIVDQKIAITEAIAEAEKIREKALAKQAITELEATNLVDQLKKVEARNLFLENQNTELSNITKDQDNMLNSVKNALHATEIQVIDKENEVSQLRNQNDAINQALNLKNDELSKCKQSLIKIEKDLASAKVYKNWVIGLVGGFLLWTIIKNIIMIYSPIKFRI